MIVLSSWVDVMLIAYERLLNFDPAYLVVLEKFDVRIGKILGNVIKEFDSVAKILIKNEFGSLFM